MKRDQLKRYWCLGDNIWKSRTVPNSKILGSHTPMVHQRPTSRNYRSAWSCQQQEPKTTNLLSLSMSSTRWRSSTIRTFKCHTMFSSPSQTYQYIDETIEILAEKDSKTIRNKKLTFYRAVIGCYEKPTFLIWRFARLHKSEDQRTI